MAAELVAGALVSTFVEMTIDNLASRFQDIIRGRKLKFNKTLLSKLKVKLLSIDALADDAEQKQFRDARVREWLLKAKDTVFEAEDLLDEIDYELSRYEVDTESQSAANKVWNSLKSSVSSSSFENEIESRIKQVLGDLDDLASQKGYLGLKKASGVGVGSGLGSEVSQKSSSTSLLSESVFGRDDDKRIIFDWLTSDTDNSNKPSILSIVGMGGLGKTTLAQYVYNDPTIEGKFDIKAWVCVSDDFDVFKVTRTILERITKSPDDSRDLEMVQGRLIEKLKGKSFLLILDDVWNESRSEWEKVKKALDFGAQGSRILVTTRSNKVACTMRSKEHILHQLQENCCWRLFAEHAFQDDNPQPSPDCKEIGTKIVEKCKGLPLALKTMGSLLHNKTYVSEWESILKSEIWELADSNIVPALALSYHHLPSHLKRCFAYCALFPKDYMFDREGLIQLWMAENFLRCRQQSKSPEEVGEQYFNDLLSRSFFQQQSSNIEGTYFVMHDLLNDLAKYVAKDICFRLGVDTAKGIPKTTCHFSVATSHVKKFDGFGSLHDAERLHTFMITERQMKCGPFGSYWHWKISIDYLFSKFKVLRVLSLSCHSNITEVPNSVSNLKHLRSLDLSTSGIKELPESTCSLYNLLILKLNYCRNLQELPSNLHQLTNLRCLEFINTEVRKVPAYLEKLKNLQVLSSFYVGKSKGFSIQQLGKLNLHGSLTIGELQNIENPSDALEADLKNKTHIAELSLRWDRDQNLDDSMKERDECVVENLQPPKHLEKLSISNYDGTKFPSWLSDNSLSNVVSLTLGTCKYCLCLPPLGLFPFLKDLRISGLDGVVGIDADFYGSSSSPFTSLETLQFSFMKEWEKWECQAVTCVFPRLQHLSIRRCPKLKGRLPEQLHLKTLEIYYCEQLEASAPRALESRLHKFGKLQFDWATLRELSISGHNMEASMIGHNISDTSLEYLNVYSCPYSQICDICDSLKTFSLDFFPTIRSLTLEGFRNLQMISQEQAHNHLKCLRISKCPQLESLPERMHILLPSLYELMIEDCPKVELFPGGGLPPDLKEISVNNGYKLIASLKGALGDNPSLETLNIGKLDAECFPDESLLPLSLTCLCINDCPDLKTLNYKGLRHLSSLKSLILQHCRSLQCLPEGLCHLSSLESLYLDNCPSLQCLPEGLCHLSSLESLSLSDCPSLQHLPEDLCHLSSLESLSLSDCPSLQHLPEDLCHLLSLRSLYLDNCPSFQCLPENGLPKSISSLTIQKCPLLQQRCQKPEGEDWPKIAHIQVVRIG